jgi:hypothetical protein
LKRTLIGKKKFEEKKYRKKRKERTRERKNEDEETRFSVVEI